MFLLRDSVTLFVEDQGGQGMPVVFQHGLGGDASQTREVFPRSNDLRMVTVECRCHGRSDAGPVEHFSIATLTADVSNYIEQNFTVPVTVGGISMGAAIGLRLAVKRPDLVRGLVIGRPAWLEASSPENLEPIRAVADLLLEYGPTEGLARFERTEIVRELAIVAPDNLSSLRAYFARRDWRHFGRMLSAIAADGPGVTRTEISTIAVPTVVVGTTDDLIHPLEYARVLAALIPGADLREIVSKRQSRGGYSEAFREVLRDFCSRVA